MQRRHHLPFGGEWDLKRRLSRMGGAEHVEADTLLIPEAALGRRHLHRGLRHVTLGDPAAGAFVALDLGAVAVQEAAREVRARHHRIRAVGVGADALPVAQVGEAGLREALAPHPEVEARVHAPLGLVAEDALAEQAAVGAQPAQRVELQGRLLRLSALRAVRPTEAHQRLRGHLALRERACLVRADDGRRPEVVDRAPPGHDGMARRHLGGTDAKHDHHDKREAVRDERDRHDQTARRRGHQQAQVVIVRAWLHGVLVPREEGDGGRDNDDPTTGHAYHEAQEVDRLLQRVHLHVRLGRRGEPLRDEADLGAHASRDNLALPKSRDHAGSAEEHVRLEGRVRLCRL
mmetsp:Transcript_53785/g.138572  ORF Transcript_53785/g.138572 Transcript_53785/m.138572 type:complete len:347 (-) Transcript_53785:690-1730(-)